MAGPGCGSFAPRGPQLLSHARLVPGTYVLLRRGEKGVGGRDKPGHDSCDDLFRPLDLDIPRGFERSKWDAAIEAVKHRLEGAASKPLVILLQFCSDRINPGRRGATSPP
jgi:hypothetical protein